MLRKIFVGSTLLTLACAGPVNVGMAVARTTCIIWVSRLIPSQLRKWQQPILSDCPTFRCFPSGQFNAAYRNRSLRDLKNAKWSGSESNRSAASLVTAIFELRKSD